MRRALSVCLLLLSIVFVVPLSVPSAKSEIPEIDGVYDDPNFRGLKVRVFVNKQKPLSASPIMICNPDNDSGAVVSPTGWKLDAQWIYNLNPSSVPAGVGSSNLSTISSLSFSQWTSASSNKVNALRGLDTAKTKQAYDGKNIIAWGRTNGSALAVTYVRYYASTGEVVDVDTIMNKRFQWGWSQTPQCAQNGVYDAQNILTHEVGHWFGLSDHYTENYIDNTMYGYGSTSEVKKNTLTTGDATGVSQIYQ